MGTQASFVFSTFTLFSLHKDTWCVLPPDRHMASSSCSVEVQSSAQKFGCGRSREKESGPDGRVAGLIHTRVRWVESHWFHLPISPQGLHINYQINSIQFILSNPKSQMCLRGFYNLFTYGHPCHRTDLTSDQEKLFHRENREEKDGKKQYMSCVQNVYCNGRGGASRLYGLSRVYCPRRAFCVQTFLCSTAKWSEK